MSLLESFTVDGVHWDVYEWIDGGVIYQRRCPHCDNGLLLSPVRWCPFCKRGWLTQRKDPRGAP